MSAIIPRNNRSAFGSELGGLLSQFFGRPMMMPFEQFSFNDSWMPAMDVEHVDGQMVISAELAGINPDDVNIELDGDVLTISGKRTNEHEDNKDGVLRRERYFGSFERRLRVPPGIDPEAIVASYRQGVLRVALPWNTQDEDASAKRIPISTDEA